MSSSDDVSRIHSRYSLTLLAPSSWKRSLLYSMAVAVALATTSTVGFGLERELALAVGLVLAALAGTQLLDSRLIKTREYSKAIHLSLYTNILWLLILLSALAAAFLLSRPEASLAYIGLGMLIAASFRIGLLTTVLGSGMGRAWTACLIQPVAVFLALVPAGLWEPVFSDPFVLASGISFMAIATIWSLLTDRAGRPGLSSTHALVQAYLNTGTNVGQMESILEEHSKVSEVSTSQLRLRAGGGSQDVRLVLPAIHPGPFHPVGGSNMPFRIYQALNSSAMVMHSISDHALNLPSGKELENYLCSLEESTLAGDGASCTEPIAVQVNRSRVLGIRFGRTAVLFLSLSPHGTEDLPSSIRAEIDEYSRNRNYESVMVVDCHNAMGEEITSADSEDMLQAARSCLDTLTAKADHPFRFGYANSTGLGINAADIAMGGLGVLCLEVNGRRCLIGWADANNMENGAREFVVESLAGQGYEMLEIATSDTHFSRNQVRTKQGYYHLGAVTPREKLAEWYLGLARQAAERMARGSFEILENRSDQRVMGSKVFEHLVVALDSSLRITKIFMAGCVALFLVTLAI